MRLRVLTWNLKHGRAVPSAGHDLFGEFAQALAGWEWDVALLQEVPPWWPAPLAQRLGAEQRTALTSRNSLLALRRALAMRWPDAIKSNGGGANAILVRNAVVLEHRVARLCRRPERRWVHAARIGDLWLANLHAAASPDQARNAAATVLTWSRGGAAVLGGDFNLRAPLALDGFEWAGGHHVDHVFAAGRRAVQAAEVLDRGHLSDHAPVLVSLE